ncbi:DUF2225 domain-containing protein [Acidaminobacter sp. JC074]|uniref:DUF2225 domain-containing protein n=1 Tax=Acidaminobacter sp. JC074 TaxID=2530199 RepID=UPI002ECFE4CE
MIKIHLYDKSVVCPVCKHEFLTKKVKSKSIKVLERDTDLKAEYEFEDPTFYGVNVCPNCGHARFESDFNDVNVTATAKIKNEISLKWKARDFCQERTIKEAIEAHKLALINYNLTNYKPSVIAKTCLRLSWFYKEIDATSSDKFAMYARQKFEEAYVEEAINNPKEELMIVYLLGEFNRREGNYKKAMDWFTMGLRNPFLRNDRFLNRTLREQMAKVKDEYKKTKEIAS